ncbi:MAG: helix-turn-helix transcriptional regulator [Pseudomonadota bacterium]
MESIRNVLVTDAHGRASERYRLVATQDWDQIRQWSDLVYMPYTVSPTGKAQTPNSVLDAARIGHFTLSRFHYGIQVNIRDFSPAAGTGMVLTTLRGAARHWAEPNAYADTGIGEAFLVDNSRTHYWVDFDRDHLQVNLTFEHEALAQLHARWFGSPADERMWRCKFRLGGANSSWIALLGYVCNCITEMPEAVTNGPLGRHLEEMIGVHLLTAWRARADGGADDLTRAALAPRHVLLAEQYIREHARDVPTLSMIAAAAGVSVRSLSNGFRTYRGSTPMDALREQRLQGARAEILLAANDTSVREIAYGWGYVNLGLFAAAYRKRFGEYPSTSLARTRASWVSRTR